jgi:four helix bundle protein
MCGGLRRINRFIKDNYERECREKHRKKESVQHFGVARGVLITRGMSKPEFTPEALQQRLVRFGAAVVAISSKLPKNQEGGHIAKQILRSGTSVAANYAEARGAESRADFIHKLRIVLKELNETLVWLQMIAESGLLLREKLAPTINENQELCAIMAASLKTLGAFDRLRD